MSDPIAVPRELLESLLDNSRMLTYELRYQQSGKPKDRAHLEAVEHDIEQAEQLLGSERYLLVEAYAPDTPAIIEVAK